MPVLFSDPIFLRHETGRHVEIPARLTSIVERLKLTGLGQRCSPGAFKPLDIGAVESVHERGVVRRVESVTARGGGMLDADTVISPMSLEAALAAAGAGCAAVDAIIAGPARQALCLVRPPGHHATRDQSMGFCLFNNIALAAEHARKRHGLSRILIVDWDVHHGNGTQDIFYDDPEVFFLSVHRYGHGFFPGTGAADETGAGLGLGATINVPVRFGTTRRDYHDLVRRAVEKAADKIRPELVLVSAGFDAHRLDPIGSLGLETEDFAELTRLVCDVAKTHAGGRLVSCLEGGYNLTALAESVAAHLEVLLGYDAEMP